MFCTVPEGGSGPVARFFELINRFLHRRLLNFHDITQCVCSLFVGPKPLPPARKSARAGRVDDYVG